MVMPISLQNALLKELDQLFKKSGFVRVSSNDHGHRFDAPFPGGRRSIGVNWHIRKPALVLDPPYASITIDEVEQTVAQFEERNPLAKNSDISWRSTVSMRLDQGEILRLLTMKWTLVREDDCLRVATDFVKQTLHNAEVFWESVSSPSAILSKLSDDPSKTRAFALPDYIAAERAIVLAKMLLGEERSRVLADDRLARLSGASKVELEKWLSHASSSLFKSTEAM
jgi:hypothetical protein